MQIEEKDAPVLSSPTIQSALSTILLVLPSPQIIGSLTTPETAFEGCPWMLHSPEKANCGGFRMLPLFLKTRP